MEHSACSVGDYVADTGNHTIRKITPAGVVGSADGIADDDATLVALVHGDGSRSGFEFSDAAPHGGRGAGTVVRVEPEQEILTAAQLDAMTPDERRDEFERRVVRDAAQLSDELRERIRSTAERLARARADR